MNFPVTSHPGEIPARKALKPAELADYLARLPALLWRVELAKSRIEFLNDHRLEVLGDKTFLFLQNAEFRRQVVQPEDGHLLTAFADMMKAGAASAVAFRIGGPGREPRWLKLAGWPQAGDPRFYQGYLLDVTETARAIQSVTEKDAELQVMIELADHPVLLVDYDTRGVVAQNSPAADLFGHSPDEFRRLGFADLTHRGMTNTVLRVWEELVFEKKWAGKLSFVRRSHAAFSAEAGFRLLTCRDRRFVRISLTHVEAGEPAAAARSAGNGARPAPAGDHARLLEERLAGLSAMPDILQTLLDNPPPRCRYEAILFSDIQARKNRVAVYGRGAAFASMAQGEIFSYEGTIAQQIELFRLDHLIVDDTLESIKAIDWALFIPKGIRSYFAKPFYTRGVLRAVMILCSTAPHGFQAERLDDYALLFRPFRNAVEAWRQAQRRSRRAAAAR
ncbi:MAG: PAS domain-containing protein [Thermodesulfobacteriota bacterium]